MKPPPRIDGQAGARDGYQLIVRPSSQPVYYVSVRYASTDFPQDNTYLLWYKGTILCPFSLKFCAKIQMLEIKHKQ